MQGDSSGGFDGLGIGNPGSYGGTNASTSSSTSMESSHEGFSLGARVQSLAKSLWDTATKPVEDLLDAGKKLAQGKFKEAAGKVYGTALAAGETYLTGKLSGWTGLGVFQATRGLLGEEAASKLAAEAGMDIGGTVVSGVTETFSDFAQNVSKTWDSLSGGISVGSFGSGATSSYDRAAFYPKLLPTAFVTEAKKALGTPEEATKRAVEQVTGRSTSSMSPAAAYTSRLLGSKLKGKKTHGMVIYR